ncbi:MAG: hypothetical protein GXP26_17350 [Planctomycetes bacterium]|nr:hypothetical protein [Planctomycetota bacterium]
MPHQRAVASRFVGCAVATILCWLAVVSLGFSEETTARLRLAWGSGGETKQRWTGSISIDGAKLSDLQPLGVEVDAPAGLLVVGERLVIGPLVKRGFDGCDVTVQADEEAMVRVELRTDQSPHPTIIETPLRQIIREQLRRPLDAPGSFFLAHRSPGDRLRVILSRDHLVFDPEESWTLRLEPNLQEELGQEPAQLNIQLRAAGDKEVIWQAGRQITSADKEPLEFEIECPAQEGAYHLTISARIPEGFATRFVPGRRAKVLASREVEFVVVDPLAKLPMLTEAWQPLLTIDPANPSWWQRLPAWAQTARFNGKPTGTTGNIRPVVRDTAAGKIVELPSTASGTEPNWQSYTLPVRETGIPHLVELKYPLDQEQHLEISVIEPNAAGLVMKIGGSSGLYSQGVVRTGRGEMGTHQLIFWPRTKTPQLLIVNRHSKSAAQYGKISLSQHDYDVEATAETPLLSGQGRIVAGYISKPTYPANFGAAEMLDAKSGLSVQSWSTFLEGANRLAQYLRYSGQNSVVLSVAADGSALYPSKVLNPSPRYDTGMLASNGQDPLHKDVLELLLRVFDREGIRIIPAVQFAAPLPALEQLRLSNDDQQVGIACIGPRGTTWQQENLESHGLAPHYNLLNQTVQAELRRLVSELPRRYSKHASFAGVAVQLSGNGYGMLPGLNWGLDDSTVAAFTQETGIRLAGEGPLRFRDRANQLLGAERERWAAWRVKQLVEFYSQLAKELQAERRDLQLMLTTEDLFAGGALQRRVRQSLASPVRLSQVLFEHGIDIARLNELPEVIALPPYRLAASDRLQDRALDLRINSSTDQGELLSLSTRTASLFHHSTSRNHLRSFDQRGPFGPDRTYLTLSDQPMPAGDAQRRHIIRALSRHDVYTLVDGGEFLPLAQQATTRELLRTIQQLPGLETPARTRKKQPVVLRTYRSEASTTLAVINESPWAVTVKLPLKTSAICGWRRLGVQDDVAESSGRLAEDSQEWLVELKPYDLRAWRFESATVRVGELQVSLPELANEDLRQRIEKIESRTGNLNIERRYLQLQNPGFELEEEGVRLLGWQPRVGSAGKVEVTTSEPQSGTRAVRLQSDDGIGVAVQSHLFPMPETGQLVVSAYLKGKKMPTNARLYIALEDGSGGRTYRQYATLGGERKLDEQWARYEFPVDDLPIDSAGQMRIQFHLTGKAEVLIDDVELYDLRFDKARRGALVKRVYAAKTALDSGQVTDCLRLVDEYWSQYLVEFVPPFETETVQLAEQLPTPESKVEEEEKPGIGTRLRGWVPRIWR